MSWWCVALRDPWSWAWRAYPGVWLAMLAIVASYLYAWHRHGGVRTKTDRRRRRRFLAGVVVLWLASDWPLATLGAGYLASAHMTQYLLYTLVAAPLLVAGLPEWTAARTLKRPLAAEAARMLRNPIVAAVIFNGILAATHAPIAVDSLRVSQWGSFLLDVAWLFSGLVLWWPVLAPIAGHRISSYAMRGLYLFLAAGVAPMLPGGFLTFASFPLYEIYELAPRVHGFDALDDQQLAGAIMKVGNIPIVWPVLALIFWRWSESEANPPATPVASPTDDPPTPTRDPDVAHPVVGTSLPLDPPPRTRESLPSR